MSAAVEIEFEPEPVVGEELTANFLLYGPPKSGKTAAGASSKPPVVILTAEPKNATRYAQLKYKERVKVFRITGLQSLVKFSHWLETPAGKKVKTVVLDTVSEVYRILIEDLSNRAMRPSLPIYGDAGKHLERFCRSLCEDPAFSAVIVAHETTSKDEAEGNIQKLPYTGSNSSDTLAQKLMGMVDIVGYTAIVEQEGQPTVYAAQLLNANGRKGGDRFDSLGKYRALDLSEWIDVISSAAPDSADNDKTEAEAEVSEVAAA